MPQGVATRCLRGTTQAWRAAPPLTERQLRASAYVRAAQDARDDAGADESEMPEETARGQYEQGSRCAHRDESGAVCGVRLFRVDSRRWARCPAHHPRCRRCTLPPHRRLRGGLCEVCVRADRYLRETGRLTMAVAALATGPNPIMGRAAHG